MSVGRGKVHLDADAAADGPRPWIASGTRAEALVTTRGSRSTASSAPDRVLAQLAGDLARAEARRR
jgi:hypothetical protein